MQSWRTYHRGYLHLQGNNSSGREDTQFRQQGTKPDLKDENENTFQVEGICGRGQRAQLHVSGERYFASATISSSETSSQDTLVDIPLLEEHSCPPELSHVVTPWAEARMQNYEALHDSTAIHDDEAPPPIVATAEPPRSRFSHIEDLDTFFQDVYDYHQGQGYTAILLRTSFGHLQKILLMLICTFLLYCVDYECLRKYNSANKCIRSPTDAWQLMPWWFCTTLIVSGFWFVFCVMIGDYKKCYMMYDIGEFYRNHLHINDKDLGNVTWFSVKRRLREAQENLKMVIHKTEISDLDICHRILRQTNYFVALTNKHHIPPRIQTLWGEEVYWTPWLAKVMTWILFGNWFLRKIGFSLFEKSFQLRDQYKKQNLRPDNIRAFRSQIKCYILFTVLLIPLMFSWHCVQTFFKHAAMVRTCPSFLTKRRFSDYSRLFIRHFNELDHELEVRLNRAVKPANKYMGSFYNPIVTIFTNTGVFITSALLGGIVIVGLYYPALYMIEHFLVWIPILYILQETLGNLKPDEAISTDRVEVLKKVCLHTHYLPERALLEPHTERVRTEFQQLFQYRFASILESLLQSVMVPYILYLHILPRCGELVDFFRCFTVNVTGVGDVCSFAQLDIRRHGNPLWHEKEGGDNNANIEQAQMAENGKLELSLAHFSTNNPDWRAPGADDPTVSRYIASITSNNQQQYDHRTSFMDSHRSSAPFMQHLEVNTNASPQYQSHYSSRPFAEGVGLDGGEWPATGDVRHQPQNYQHSWRVDEPLSAGAPSPFSSTVDPATGIDHEEYKTSGMWQVDGPNIGAALQMSMNAEMIHNIHNMQSQRYSTARSSQQPQQRNLQETTPLLTSVSPRH